MTRFADAAILEEAAKDVNLVQSEHITAEATGGELRAYVRTVLGVDDDWMVDYLAERWLKGYGPQYEDKPPFFGYMIGYVEGLALGKRLAGE